MWELQSHVHHLIGPSILKHAQEQEDPLGWLCKRVTDLSWEDDQDYDAMVAELRADYADAEGKPIYWGPLVERLTEAAIEHGSTTNGGWEFYIDDYTSVPFCEDEDLE